MGNFVPFRLIMAVVILLPSIAGMACIPARGNELERLCIPDLGADQHS